METPLLLAVGFVCAAAAAVWARSARLRWRVAQHVKRDLATSDAVSISRATFVNHAIAAAAFAAGAVGIVGAALLGAANAWPVAVLAIPALISVVAGRNFAEQARQSKSRWEVERRAEETLSQDELAPKRWAERLAPATLPHLAGFEIGTAYQPGTGMMAGDFFDVVRLSEHRLAAVIGDVAGHGIDASITAFQAKYLLRVFLHQYRDPAQAVEQLNAQISALGRYDEFVSLCVAVFDSEAATLRWASAGHPPAWLWHGRDLQPLAATGPLVMLDPKAGYFSREIAIDEQDLLVMYTDGLSEARNGPELYGEERIASAIRRDPSVPPDVLCKDLLEAARDFATSPMSDDVAVLAIRRVAGGGEPAR